MIRVLTGGVQAVGHNLLFFNQLRLGLAFGQVERKGHWLRIGQGCLTLFGFTEGTESYPRALSHLKGRDAAGFAEMCVA